MYNNILKTILSLNLENSSFLEPDENDLGQNFKLVSDNSMLDNRNNYSHLYKNGVKISDTLFRRGGMSKGFDETEYCMLIAYHNLQKSTIGNHCIIDLNGDIVLEASELKYPYHLKGVIAVLDEKYYNLKTKEIITKGYNTIKSESYIFVENQYNSEYEKGVYKIEYSTGNFEIFQ